ncbi:MFS transporter [Alkalihalobacterium chitinilyticum]|uniref:MFS transporter n=1 Tax=Alkalihalobacterium chitinilyticum TaxID=2980103 RepID=A0ABT5VJG5_9BACI|nr:MFS transporter [Alkalihalobacterium chitinilyticum]MDE5415410.1 MFS transporter [Alkalihalobacterium chitinilyticum]
MNELIKNKSFLLIVFGQGSSGLGNTFSVFIMSWLLYDLTGSIFAMGTIWFVYVTSMIICHIISGPYLDRYDKKYIMIFSEWMKALIFVLPFISLISGNLTAEILYIVVILLGLIEPLFRPACMSYLTSIIKEKNLLKANATLESVLQIMMVVGPSLGGLLIGIFKPETVIFTLIIVLTFSGVMLLFVPKENRSWVTEERSSWFSEFKEGLNFFKQNRLFLWIAGLIFFVNLGSGATQPMLLPFVLEVLNGNSLQYGFISSGVAFGMLLGSLLVSHLRKIGSLKLIMLGALTLSGFCLMWIGSVSEFYLAFSLILLYGLFIVTFNINNTTLYQQRVPANIRGRVFLVRGLLARIGIPVGAIIGALIAEFIGFRSLFMLLGALTIIPCIIAWNLPSFNQLNSYKEQDENKVSI